MHRAALRGKLGNVAFKRGDHRRSRAELERAVRDLGGRLPRSSIGLVLSLLAEVIVQTAHTIAPRIFLARRPTEGADREFLKIRLYSRLAYVYWFSAGKVFCAWAHLREMNLAERYPPTAELAQAYSEHAPVMTIAPWFARGITYAQRSLAIRVELGDPWGQGQSLNFYGVALYAASRYGEAIEKLNEAVRLLEQTGDRWEVNTATWNIALARYRLGDLAGAVAVSRELYAAAVAIGDETAAGTSLSVWSRASSGFVPGDLIATQIAKGNDDAQTNADVQVAEGVRLLAGGAYADAVTVFGEATRIIKDAGLRQEYVAPAHSWLATALRSEADARFPLRLWPTANAVTSRQVSRAPGLVDRVLLSQQRTAHVARARSTRSDCRANVARQAPVQPRACLCRPARRSLRVRPHPAERGTSRRRPRWHRAWQTRSRPRRRPLPRSFLLILTKPRSTRHLRRASRSLIVLHRSWLSDAKLRPHRQHPRWGPQSSGPAPNSYAATAAGWWPSRMQCPTA